MIINKQGQEFIIKDTHRGLWYEDGKLTKVLEAGRYEIPAQKQWFKRLPTVECVLVNVRERDLTIKGQEILTADKVALRVSILVQFRVTDAKAAVQTVENYEERLYSDVQLAARRRWPRWHWGRSHQPQPAERGHPDRDQRGRGRLRRGDSPGHVNDLVFPATSRRL